MQIQDEPVSTDKRYQMYDRKIYERKNVLFVRSYFIGTPPPLQCLLYSGILFTMLHINIRSMQFLNKNNQYQC